MKKVVRKTIIIILVVIGCLNTNVYAKEKYKNVAKNTRGAVTVKNTNLYKEDSTKSKKIKYLTFGDKVVIKEKSNKWYKVSCNKTIGYIKKDNIVEYDKTKKHIALTFDDGPHVTNTPIVINALEKNKCKATFFVVGNRINYKTGKLLKREINLGYEIGNHSYSHPNLVNLSSSQIKRQFRNTDRAVKKYTGQNPTLVRVPYGAYNKTVLRQANRTSVLWTVDTLDWKYRNTSRLISYINQNARDKDIVLMHDIHITTAKAVNRICKNLKKKNFEMVTVTELLAISKK